MMKHYAYDEPEFDRDGRIIGNTQYIFSEDDLRAKQYPEYLARHNLSFKDFSFEAFLDEWRIVNWACEIDGGEE